MGGWHAPNAHDGQARHPILTASRREGDSEAATPSVNRAVKQGDHEPSRANAAGDPVSHIRQRLESAWRRARPRATCGRRRCNIRPVRSFVAVVRGGA